MPTKATKRTDRTQPTESERTPAAGGRRSRRLLRSAGIVGLLVVLAGCQHAWPSPRGDNANTGVNPAEVTIGAGNAGSLVLSHQTDLGLPPGGSPSAFTVPVVAFGLVYVPVGGTLSAIPTLPGPTCPAAPADCTARWTADLDGFAAYGSAVVAGNEVYLSAVDPVAFTGRLFAFDAQGDRGCSGTPLTCEPLWVADGATLASPVVADGKVYVADGADMRVEVYDAAGASGCGGTPVTCAPLWTSTFFAPAEVATPALVDGRLFVVGQSGVAAFDAAGVAGCSGTPRVCSPLWSSPLGSATASSPVVTGGRVHVAVPAAGLPAPSAQLVAFDAAGVQGCSAAPITCTPIWSTPLGDGLQHAQLAVAGGQVLVATKPATGAAALAAFPADGSTCGGTPMTCTPTWSAPGILRGQWPVVANGLVWASTLTPTPRRVAVDLAGSSGCAGSPSVCAPVVSTPYPAGTAGPAPVVGDGALYQLLWGAPAGHITLQVFRPAP